MLAICYNHLIYLTCFLFNSFCIIPVSYTHLDVYKRQYVNRHLRILSGFYGILNACDGVVPYRLEMQAKLPVDGCRDLYEFWGDRLYRELVKEDQVIINLASKEYSKAVEPYIEKDEMCIRDSRQSA